MHRNAFVKFVCSVCFAALMILTVYSDKSVVCPRVVFAVATHCLKAADYQALYVA